jgi:hyperosmotically inducible protein
MYHLMKYGFIFFISLFISSYVFAQSSDSTITSDVKNRIAADKSLEGTNVIVKTTNGVVTLSGTVASETQATKATEVVQSLNGVKDVDTSHLKVKDSQQPLTDAFITAKIKGIFIREKLFGDKDIAAMGITVETNNGIVSLGGTADSQVQANNAIKLARSVSGVKNVKSSIQISDQNVQ